MRTEEEYVIRPEDFAMVCPNCHAMLHTALGGEYPTVESLASSLKK